MAQLARQVGTIRSVFPTNIGWCGVDWHNKALRKLTLGHPSGTAALCGLSGELPLSDTWPSSLERFVERVQEFLSGRRHDFRDIPLQLPNRTAFQTAVLDACRQIPWGQTLTYGQLAEQAGSPRAARAVGSVMAGNDHPLVIPCHRVVASNSLGGFSSPNGLDTKRQLLRLEGSL